MVLRKKHIITYSNTENAQNFNKRFEKNENLEIYNDSISKIKVYR
jgi:hypothetical protein